MGRGAAKTEADLEREYLLKVANVRLNTSFKVFKSSQNVSDARKAADKLIESIERHVTWIGENPNAGVMPDTSDLPA